MLKYYDSSVVFGVNECALSDIVRKPSAGSYQYQAPEGSTLHFPCLRHMYMCGCLGRQLPQLHMEEACHLYLSVESPVHILTDLSNNAGCKTENLAFAVKFMCCKCLHNLKLVSVLYSTKLAPIAKLLQYTLITTTQLLTRTLNSSILLH